MIETGNEGIPSKEEGALSLKKSQSNIAINQPVDNPTTKSTTSTSTSTTTNSQGLFRTQFQQKTKILREVWTQHQLDFNKNNCQLFFIILLTIFGIVFNIAAISSNRWTCDLQLNFGLWDTCYRPVTDGPIWNLGNKTNNDSVETRPVQEFKCAKQGVRWVEIELAQPSRIIQVYASQGLIVIGCILYVFSLVTICLAYRFVQTNSSISLKNCLIASISVQFFAFVCMLVGLYLFIATEQLSVSVGILFVYFGLAMFSSNTINFITVEYKMHKSQSYKENCQ